jgi:hypothetical protein
MSAVIGNDGAGKLANGLQRDRLPEIRLHDGREVALLGKGDVAGVDRLREMDAAGFELVDIRKKDERAEMIHEDDGVAMA